MHTLVHAFSINLGELLAIAGNTTDDPKENKGDPKMTSLQPPERTATLIVIKHIYYTSLNETASSTINKISLYTASDFMTHVNSNNLSPFDSPGSESRTSVSIGQTICSY